MATQCIVAVDQHLLDPSNPNMFIGCTLFFYGVSPAVAPSTHTYSDVLVAILATDTIAQIGAKILAAADAEAARINVGALANVIAPSFAKLR